MRVARTFAFIDLCGFTAFTECHGDGVAVKVLAELRAGLREIAARRGVRVAKWLGDGAMLSSTSTASLVAMVVEIRHRLRGTIPDLSVRVGMDAGPVIMFEGDDYIGRAVNLASRICHEATPDQVLATWCVARDVPGWVTLGDPRAVHLKGFADFVEVLSVDVATLSKQAMVSDPVCGLTIPSRFATSASGPAPSPARFCSLDCAEAFAAQNPDRGAPFGISG